MLIIKGDEVSFLRADDDQEIFVPKNFLICHDPLGEIIRACDFQLRPCTFVRNGISHSDTTLQEIVKRYYGEDEPMGEIKVELIVAGWEEWCDVSHIRYRRVGKLAADYEHKYASPQKLFRTKDPEGYKVVHPDACVANERGFVWP